jgi:hypothetical protein
VSCELYVSYWQAHDGAVPTSDVQLAICHTNNSTCEQYTSFVAALHLMATAQEKDEAREAMQSLSFLFNAFIMMQVSKACNIEHQIMCSSVSCGGLGESHVVHIAVLNPKYYASPLSHNLVCSHLTMALTRSTASLNHLSLLSLTCHFCFSAAPTGRQRDQLSPHP